MALIKDVYKRLLSPSLGIAVLIDRAIHILQQKADSEKNSLISVGKMKKIEKLLVTCFLRMNNGWHWFLMSEQTAGNR